MKAHLKEWGRVLFAPTRPIRAFVRRDEVGLTILAALIGALAGGLVVCITRATMWAHVVFYHLHNGGRLSGLSSLPLWRCVLVLGCGGLLVGLMSLVRARFMSRRLVDPVEANALHGGRMSVRDSLFIVAQTVASNGAGASIGLEAGFTQISAACGSWLGQIFRVRRADLRILVGAGAAGGISAAFHAPIAGAFYAFELIIGSYSLENLFPIAVASVAGMGVMHLLGVGGDIPKLVTAWHMSWQAAPGVVILAIICALVSIITMYCVTKAEELFRYLPVPFWIRPAAGGVLLAFLAARYPAVMSAGHAGLVHVLSGALAPSLALGLLGAKMLASSVSLGAGFRGGMFFASLFIGALAGEGFGACLAPYGLAPVDHVVCAILGMSAVASAVIGGPLTIVCMTLEMVDNITIGSGVIVASVLSMLTVRRLFGYSFATWRFHLRGESIRSAVDVGRIRELNVQTLMRVQVRCLKADIPISVARKRFPLGAGERIILVDDAGRYEGMVFVAELNTAEGEDVPVSSLAHHRDVMLVPDMGVKEAVELFTEAEADALAVVEDRLSRQVVGQLSEQHTLRSYAAVLEHTRRDLAGEVRSAV